MKRFQGTAVNLRIRRPRLSSLLATLTLAVVAGATAGAGVRPAVASSAALPPTQTFDLCVKAGSVTMPDAAVIPIWGFAAKPAGADCADPSVVAQLPGPTLTTRAGTLVTINVHNLLAENVALSLPGQPIVPDTIGAAPAASTSYTFLASAPGTFLYESGTNPRVQVAMGLYGAFIVRPVTFGRAYNSMSTAFDDEALLVLSEIDPALNAAPGSFDFLDYSPRYWLINGKAYPDTARIPASPVDRLLFRYVNAGLMNHTMQVTGFHQRVIATDGYPLAQPFEVTSQTIAAGQTTDLMATVPDGPLGTLFPVFSAQQHITNGPSFPGGMLTFVELALPPAPPPNPCADANPPSGVSVAIDLWATAGSVTMPDGAVIPIWGYTNVDPSLGGVAQLPGPQLVVNPGDAVTLTLHNTLAENVSVVIPGLPLVPDTTGAASGGSATYSFVATDPGTYIYESAVNERVQVAMGLYGSLVVRPTVPGQAYNCPAGAYDAEATLVLGEIDPALNASPDPNTFDFLDYDPKYWLINGKPYPDTAPILADAGDRVLFRYVNGGLRNHAMQVAGLHMRVVAEGGHAFRYGWDVVSLTVASGETFDLIGTLPSGTPSGTKYPVFSAEQHLTNSGSFPGGMLTFIIDKPLGVLSSCDSPVTMSDALVIARYVVGLRPGLPCQQNADINRDGRVSMTDALKAARIVVGLSR